MKRILCLALFAAIALAAQAAYVFQYPVATGNGFLWVPPKADRVRGVLLGGRTLIEAELVKDAAVRQACADEKIAIIFLNKGVGGVDVQAVLDDAAKVSGYAEIAKAPLMVIGHSAGGPQAKDVAYKYAARCWGLIQFRGGGPSIPGATDARIYGVPALMAIGQFDEFHGTMRKEDGREPWMGNADSAAAFNAQDVRQMASLIVEGGAGHFAWSELQAPYIALFIRKAARLRIPGDWPVDAKEPIACTAVDQTAGWLGSVMIDKPTEFPPAPYAEYKGDKTRAQWFFDEETAKANAALHAGRFGKKDQFIKWTDPYWVDAGVRYFFTNIKWVGDGQTFEVHPIFNDVYPANEPNGPKWLQTGQPVGKSDALIKVRQVAGPVVPVGDNLLRMRYDALSPIADGARVTFMAYSEGNAEFRHTERVGMMPRGFKGLNGKAQTVTFPAIGNLKVGGAPIELKATSDSGLAVEYYVACGPAIIEGTTLRIADLPARAKLPIEVKVVAYQFGSGVDPKIATAAPIEQVSSIVE